MQLVYAKAKVDSNAKSIASLLRDYRIPLVFLEACQTAQSQADPNASVAASLLEEGVASVIAMSHSVLVETARRFVSRFYGALALGQRVGQAMLEGQRALEQDSFRLPILGAGELHLQDWFVPILYQEQHDPQLFKQIPSERAERMQAKQQAARLGELPETPVHTFIGRSRELLTLERLLEQQPYAVILGQGGIGKTTLAVELARWLVRSRRFERCAFVSLEEYSHDRAVLDELGRQLCGSNYSVAEYGDDLNKALQPIQRVLENDSCLLLLDNLETLLANKAAVEPVLQLAAKLLASDPKTRLLFTTREALPVPFDHKARERFIGALDLEDAKALVMRVMANEGLELKHDDEGRTPEEVDELVNAVNGHARALVLLARELSRQGVTGTTHNLQRIMQELEQAHPGERELSLFASVELSLQRMSLESQALVKGLAVLHDDGDFFVMSRVLDVDKEIAMKLAVELIQVGLAQEHAYSYLRLDPALPHYLGLQLPAQEEQPYRQRWFEVMAQQGAVMASASLTEQGDCLKAMGRLDEAAVVYKEGIARSEKLEDTRGMAVKKGQLASVHLLQKDYSAALKGYREALDLFEQLDEPGMVATAWHQIGMVYTEQERFDESESAYRQSLSIETRLGNHASEASSLNQLANLYVAWNRPEQAVDYYRQAADIAVELGDSAKEGLRRNNLTNTLIKLGRLDEARPELLRAIECKKPFGHAAEPWTTWAILYDLEQADGNPQAAREARQQAVQAYLVYRRDGGENHSGAGRLCLAARQAMQQGETAEIAQTIAQLFERGDWQEDKAFLHNLQSILAGDRNPALAEDEEMDYQKVAELKLLLEQSSRP